MFEAIKKGGKRSIRKIAEATGIAKSSVHRHQKAIERRNQYPESEFWETAAGGTWLRLLVLGTIYIFGIKCGIGVETLSEFFYLLQLPTQIGVSPSALHKLEAEVRERILQYQHQQQSILGQSQTAIEVCAAADETNFERDVLVSHGFVKWIHLGRRRGGESTIPDLAGQSPNSFKPGRSTSQVAGQ